LARLRQCEAAAFPRGLDVADDANVNGIGRFPCFACFGAGTPDQDQFRWIVAGRHRAKAGGNSSCRLPRRLLTHPKGSALAVIGSHRSRLGFLDAGPKVATPRSRRSENSIGSILAESRSGTRCANGSAPDTRTLGAAFELDISSAPRRYA